MTSTPMQIVFWDEEGDSDWFRNPDKQHVIQIYDTGISEGYKQGWHYLIVCIANSGKAVPYRTSGWLRVITEHIEDCPNHGTP